MLQHEYVVGNKAAISVILDQEQDDVLKEFHCTACGHIVFKYYGGVRLILPGDIELEWLDVVGRPTVILCRNKRNIKLLDGRLVTAKCRVNYSIIG